ncbi:hypothetical protein TWF569_011604 [Orbilia oligospora]|uniref:Myb-like domain-containing protein n=1 Tax=Orbilia oligospora TaxID=2813651 RepID=A0A7C8JJ39_ORBOL|nr:hypothetical protein TWF102_007217 [Orbilia oligospora]KAF3102834.1 hypothetical protein TWF103_007537 [Orbilia oligospora]KAF3113113.1 hypothetical protein TWF706_010113 [Orbilia oligospora]KAF3127903.1 hypothetical protein TWF569_011604 [Orbilia oligospora]
MPAWTIESERGLLLTIIKLLNISQLPKWEEVASEMAAQGLHFTPEGCRQHFQKIKKPSSKTPSTPRKGNGGVKGAGISKTPTSSKRKLAQMNHDQDDDEIIMTPSKSSKTGNRPVSESAQESKKVVKLEIKNEQNAHTFKADKPDENGVIHISDDESLYNGD